jgi:putative resolvase
LHGQFADIASGISFDRLKEFFTLLDDVMDNKVAKIIIYKDRLSRVGASAFTCSTTRSSVSARRSS